MTTIAAPDSSDRRYRLLGTLVVVLTFGVFGGWAALAPLESAALAPGVVTVKDSRKTLQHLEGGIVEEILVAEGSSVQAGDPLVRLDSTQLEAERSMLRGQYVSLQALEARLLAERDNLDAVVYPGEFQGLQEDSRVDAAIASQNAVFKARREATAGEREVLEQRIDQLNSQNEGIRAVRTSNARLLESFATEIRDLRRLQEQGFTGKQRLTELEREQASLVGENAEALSRISGNDIRIGETRLQMIQLDRHRQTEIVDELETVQARLYDLGERLRALEDRLSRSIIRAPVSGVVLGLAVHTVGGVVRPGTPLMDIVPQQLQLVIDAEISPLDIDRVRTGDRARIRFSAFKSATTLVAEGTISTISADRLVRDSGGEPYFLAQVEVDPESLARMPHVRLLPGMPAEVRLSTGTRTPLQ
ncbi:MAG: HlyD family type I secretion periplasmic adaptor subunit [Haliea sp.]|uniref:HlyD family type I secretion periplasmic adaptor subunit n=1 Tax=Haliea sp. TaxID=1932666 RepID=UPI0032EF2CA3